MSRFVRRGTAVLLVFLAALAVQSLLVWDNRDNPFHETPVSDALSYDGWARRLAAGGLADEPVFHQAPGYPLLLAAVYRAAGDHRLMAVLWLQAILGATAVALLVPLGRIWFGSTGAGVCAAVVALLHGPLLLHALKLLPVTLAVATQAAALAALALAGAKPRTGLAIVAGAAWGAAFVTRSETLLILPLGLAVWLWTGRRAGLDRSRLRLVVLGLLAATLVVAPVTLHNLAQGDFVLVSSSAGENLFIGNQRGADGGHTPLDERAGDLFAQRELAAGIAAGAAGSTRPGDVSRYWSRRALDEIRADPAGWLQLELRKLRRVLIDTDPADMYSIHLERRHYLPLLYGAPLPSTAVWLLALIGLRIAWRRRLTACWPGAALATASAATLLAFFVSTRLRLPLIFVLMPFAGLAVARGLDLLANGGGTRRSRGGAVAVALAVFGLTGLDLFTAQPRDREVLRLASVLSMQDRTAESLQALEPLLAREHPDPLALDQAGWVYHKRGEQDRAVAFYRRALAASPEPGRMVQIYSRLGLAEAARGNTAAAADAHDAAVRTAPGSAGARFERARFRLQRGDRAGCVEDLRAALRLEPGWEEPRRVLRNLGEPVAEERE